MLTLLILILLIPKNVSLNRKMFPGNLNAYLLVDKHFEIVFIIANAATKIPGATHVVYTPLCKIPQLSKSYWRRWPLINISGDYKTSHLWWIRCAANLYKCNFSGTLLSAIPHTGKLLANKLIAPHLPFIFLLRKCYGRLPGCCNN